MEGFISEDQEKLFLKVWWAKTELRRKHLALLEEKRPLDAVRTGTQTKLGTNGKERLVISIRKRATALQTVVNTYNKHLDAFHHKFPDRPTLQKAVYDTLLQMPSNDPFWNDGIFTNPEEPWAIDPDTQDGMRLLARLTRSREEVRRIGREVRRAMGWLITEHKRVIPLMFGLKSQMDWATHSLQSVLNDPILRTLSFEDQVGSIKSILHNHFIKLTSLQLQWNLKVLPILAQTGPYQQDNQLVRYWNEQITRLTYLSQCGYLSMIAGDFDNAIGDCLETLDDFEIQNFIAQNSNDTPPLPNIENDGSDSDDDEFHRALEEDQNDVLF
ncbi:hypothetical protein PCASD_14373 [Puccinia coronata f. sp. avenae]|uniref:Uncharacterized protein n=1 Tax=Puccinia coronata f. sp. avenae TaxID=200324 RepID=A0A2N5SMK1_9BASI|nr:hypothetical protein PCASD_14373 [Puccinia coronata f. sp. avenae]